MWLLFAGMAHAMAPRSEISDGWYLLLNDRPEQAAVVAANALHQDPDDLAAHRLYAYAHTRGLRAGPQVQAMYTQWLEAEPGHVAAQLGLALTLRWSNSERGAWCEQADALLSQRPAGDAAFWYARGHLSVVELCPGDPDAVRAELIAMTETPAQLGYSLRLRAQDGEITDAWADDYERFVAQRPDLVNYPCVLWNREWTGAGLERARTHMLERALAVSDSQDPATLAAALNVLRAAGHTDADAVEAALDRVDPARRNSRQRGNGAVAWMSREHVRWDPVQGEIWEISQTRWGRFAVGDLRELELPEDLPDATVSYQNALELAWSEAIGADDKQVEASRQAWLTAPGPGTANTYAYNVAQLGGDSAEALVAITAALDTPPVWDPRGEHWADSYDHWVQIQTEHRANLLDTRAWLHHAQGRTAEALADASLAALLDPRDGVIHAHLGTIHDANGDPELALFHMGRALALGVYESDLERQVQRRGRALYRELAWAPLGFEQWVELQGPPPETEQSPQESQDDWWVGQEFPDLPLVLEDGTETSTGAYGGVVVVDVWATWCGPCVQGLPHTSDVAKDYGDDITVLAVSVDDDRGALESFDQGPRRPRYTVAWSPIDLREELGVNGIPHVFVLSDGVVTASFGGYGPGDTRMQDAVDAALADRAMESADSP